MSIPLQDDFEFYDKDMNSVRVLDNDNIHALSVTAKIIQYYLCVLFIAENFQAQYDNCAFHSVHYTILYVYKLEWIENQASKLLTLSM